MTLIVLHTEDDRMIDRNVCDFIMLTLFIFTNLKNILTCRINSAHIQYL